MPPPKGRAAGVASSPLRLSPPKSALVAPRRVARTRKFVRAASFNGAPRFVSPPRAEIAVGTSVTAPPIKRPRPSSPDTQMARGKP